MIEERGDTLFSACYDSHMPKEIWFGNFYEPAYSDCWYIDRALETAREAGFDAILLDSKAWEDFRTRFEGGERSQYVSTQEYMMKRIRELGMEYSFLALYLCGDNLYPEIRTSPPILGSAVTGRDGKAVRWYRYWSPEAHEAMERHVAGLVRTYGGGGMSHRLCSMWDPIVAPSFDDDGRQRFLSFLLRKYGSMEALFERFGTCDPLLDDIFASSRPEDSADCREWQVEEAGLYFREMQRRLVGLELVPMIAQWGFFLTFDGSRLPEVGLADLWDTAVRGIDLLAIRPYVSSINFISVPVTPDGEADCYVTAYHHRFMASVNHGRSFIGGLFLGRFLYGDVYSSVTPMEAIASVAASGASGYRAYGINGLDDGGMFDRMGTAFLGSVKEGNELFDSVLSSLGGRKEASIAILYPTAMALSEAYTVEGNKRRRLDSLGWLRLILDHGLDPSVIDCRDLSAFHPSLLIAPADSLYDGRFDDAVSSFVQEGGTLIISSSNSMGRAFGFALDPHEGRTLMMDEKAILSGSGFTVSGGTPVLFYGDGKPAAAECLYGRGRAVQLGFDYGAEYASATIPHVPRSERNSGIFPIPLLKRQFISRYTGGDTSMRGMEIAAFENGFLVINHSPYKRTVDLAGRLCDVLPHSASAVPFEGSPEIHDTEP